MKDGQWNIFCSNFSRQKRNALKSIQIMIFVIEISGNAFFFIFSFFFRFSQDSVLGVMAISNVLQCFPRIMCNKKRKHRKTKFSTPFIRLFLATHKLQVTTCYLCALATFVLNCCSLSLSYSGYLAGYLIYSKKFWSSTRSPLLSLLIFFFFCFFHFLKTQISNWEYTIHSVSLKNTNKSQRVDTANMVIYLTW